MSELSWFDFNQKNKPQGNTLAGGIFVLFATGMQVGWILNQDLQTYPWARNHSTLQVALTYAMFYIAAGIGAYAAYLVIDRLTKTNIYVSLLTPTFLLMPLSFAFYFQFTAVTFAITGSACFIAMPRSLIVVIAARFFLGLAHGYVYLTCIVHASEVMTQKLRGMIVATLNFIVVSGMLMTGSFTVSMEREVHAFGTMQWMGIAGLLFCVMGMIMIPIFTRESPVSLIRQKRFDQAVSLMCKLRHEETETWGIKNEYNELKTMVEEDEQTSPGIFDDENMRPLMRVTLLRVGSVLAFNYGLNMIRLRQSAAIFVSDDGTDFSLLCFMGIRMVSGMIALFTIDLKGRKPHFLLAFGGSGLLLVVMGVVAAFDTGSMTSVMGILQIVYELVGGFGIGMIADVYSSEAFSTIKKPKSIFYSMGIEFALQAVIIIFALYISYNGTLSFVFLIASGVLLLVITFFLRTKLPETAKMSIRQSRNEFLKTGEIVFSGSNMPPQSIKL